MTKFQKFLMAITIIGFAGMVFVPLGTIFTYAYFATALSLIVLLASFFWDNQKNEV